MTQALRKRPRDPNQLGKLVVDIATGQVEDQSEMHEGPRRGGLRDGPLTERHHTHMIGDASAPIFGEESA